MTATQIRGESASPAGSPAASPAGESPAAAKPRLSLLRIAEMNLGFLGLQFSFGLQQSNMGPIYAYLGADEASLPLLWLAGPMTGLIVQPLIGALSDRTVSRFGRRTPYFLIGALLCSLCLFAMPHSPALWAAASLLWVLDAANNVTMEPYRAYVSDRLAADQRPLGFLTQSAFTGLAQTLSYLSPSILVWWGVGADAVGANNIPTVTGIAFAVGGVLSLSTVLWSVLRVPELPLSSAEAAALHAARAAPGGALADLGRAIRDMPAPMRALALPMLCQWYAMFAYWQFVVHALARSLFDTADPLSAGFREAALLNGRLGGFYNFIAFAAALAMVPLVRRAGPARIHALALTASGAAMLVLPTLTDPWLMALPMLGIGIGWASMMGNPYVMLANAIPAERTGIYMGIFNMFIVVPMMIQSLTMPLIYRPLLGGDPRHVLMLSGALMLLAALLTLRVRPQRG